MWQALTRSPDCIEDYHYSDGAGAQCFNTHNASQQAWTDWTSRNTYLRPWVWLTCNEPLFWYQTGAPPEVPMSLVTRLATADSVQRQCDMWFPAEGNFTYGSAGGRLTAADANARLGGWDAAASNTTTRRFLWVNGEYDPWLGVSVSSDFRPGGPLASAPGRLVLLIEGSLHGSDMIMRNDVYPPIRAAHAAEIKQMVEWVGEIYEMYKTPDPS